MMCHKDFKTMMLDAEIYVDRIADMRIHDMNAVLKAVRHMALAKHEGEEDLHLRTLAIAQVQEEEHFGHMVFRDLSAILHGIRDAHKTDSTTADQTTTAAQVQQQLEDAMNFEGSTDEKKAKLFLANLGIDYNAITMDQFVTLIDILKMSKHMGSPISQRGKSTLTHGNGKRKKR